MVQKFNIAATGDMLCTRRASCYRDERFLSMVKIFKEADVAFTNLETHIHTFKGYPMPTETMGNITYQQADPFVAEEMKWMGFNLIARANNHSMDYGYDMLFEETEILDKVGLVHAGMGRNLSEATMPAYLETGNGRAALVSICTDFPVHAPAGEQRRDMHGRPGINPLRYDVRYMLNASSFANLQEICTKLGFERGVEEKKILFLSNKFEIGDKFAVSWMVRKSDLDRNIRAIKDARRAADYVFVSIHHHTHSHETRARPALRIESVARKFIDAGADAILGHGPHTIQGIEIYKKKPIFYSLGNFFHQSDTTKRFPSEMYESMELSSLATPQDVSDKRERLRAGKVVQEGYPAVRVGEWAWRWLEGFIGLCTFLDGKLVELKIYPSTLYHESRSQRGLPMLAEEEEGRRIIDYVVKCSSKWGTEIDFKKGVGYVKI